MNRTTTRLLATTAIAAGASLGLAVSAAADDYPDRAIEMIVPWGSGGGSDVLMRIVANHAEEYVGQPMPVINMPGASGTQGLEDARERDADGYTVAQIHEGLLVSYHTGLTDVHTSDFEPIASFTSSPQYLVVNADAPYDSFEEFVEYAQENPGEIRFGVTLAGVPHLHAAMMEDAADFEVSYVGHEGTGERIQALVGGHIDAAIGDIASSLEFVENGDLKFLATGASERLDATPDVPTLQELGYDLELTISRGLYAPAGTDEAILDHLSDAFEPMAQDEEFIEAINNAGGEMVLRTREEYAEYMDDLDQTVADLAEHLEQ